MANPKPSIGELSAAHFGELLIESVAAVANMFENAPEPHWGLCEWTKAQWREITTRLLNYAPQEPGSFFWFGYHGAKQDLDGRAFNCRGHRYLEASGEWLYDYSFAEYLKPSEDPGYESDWERGRFGELIVAAESEWKTTFGELEHDFEKLLASRARFKVFYCDPGSLGATQAKAEARLADCMTGGIHPQDTRIWLVTWSRSSAFQVKRLQLRPAWEPVLGVR